MLVAPDVHRDRQPLLHPGRIERPVGELGGEIAVEVPGRVEEVVGDVGFAAAGLPAGGAGHVVPLLVACERGDPGIVGPEILDLRQDHREILLRDRHRAAAVTINDRDRRAPVSLAGDAPVVEPVPHHALARALRFQPPDDRGEPIGHGPAVEFARVDQPGALGIGRGFGNRGALGFVGAGHYPDDRELEPGGELEVPFIVAGHRHDGAGSVVHQDVVGDPHRDRLAGGRVGGVPTGEDTGLSLVAHLP